MLKVGLLVTSMGNFGRNGFYNSQEVGLAKELNKYFDEVIVYKAINEYEEKKISVIDGQNNIILYQVPVKGIGINGIWDCTVMDKSLDVLIYFSDTQLSLPSVYKWCCRNNVKMYPYIGVTKSHSTNIIKRLAIDIMFKRNVRIYKNLTCFVKTPTVKRELKRFGIKNGVIVPVGLDRSLLKSDYINTSKKYLKEKYGFCEQDKLLLFVGRMTREKQPLKMIELFRIISEFDGKYRLLMVGKGELLNDVRKSSEDIKSKVCFIEQISNKDIWELYRIADCFINLNKNEIFGMAILEAMYYGCKVVAWKAPGPDMIIEDHVSGYIADNDDDLINDVIEYNDMSNAAHDRIISKFMWSNSADIIYNTVVS